MYSQGLLDFYKINKFGQDNNMLDKTNFDDQ
jgi:hypothetical protein